MTVYSPVIFKNEFTHLFLCTRWDEERWPRQRGVQVWVRHRTNQPSPTGQTRLKIVHCVSEKFLYFGFTFLSNVISVKVWHSWPNSLYIFSLFAKLFTWLIVTRHLQKFHMGAQFRVSDPDQDWIRIQSGQWIRIRFRNPDPDPGGQKWPTKVEKIHVLKCWMAFLWAAGFFCNLDILYGGLGINKLQFLIKKKINFFFQLLFFFNFWSSKPWIRIRIRIRIGLQPQPLDPDPEKMNTDPKHWCPFSARNRCNIFIYGPLFWTSRLPILNSAPTVSGLSDLPSAFFWSRLHLIFIG